MSTEYREPFYLEWNSNILVVRSRKPFTGTISWTMSSERQAAINALQPMVMHEGMKLLLSTVGYDDVLVTYPKGDTN